jgi:hypothetical protein
MTHDDPGTRFETRFTALVGCDVPIQQAPIGFPAAVPDLPADRKSVV